MFLVCDGLLNDGELGDLRRLYSELESQPGADTAEGDLKRVENNRQLLLGTRAGEIRQQVLGALNRAEHLTYALQPRSVSTPLLSTRKRTRSR